jgi:long-chain acyl-CoA synthetase
LLERAADRAPCRVAIRSGRDEVTFGALLADARRCARALTATQPAGAVVGVAMLLDPAFAVAFYGASMAGDVVVTMNPLLREEMLAHIIRTAGISVAFVTADMAARIESVRDQLPGLRALVVFDGDGHTSLRAFLAGAPDVPVPVATADPGDVACIHFTSGTTGAPKGVRLSHRNVVANAVQVAIAHELADESVTVNHIPGYHLMHLNSAVVAGATQVLCTDPDPAAPIAAANEHRADRIYGLPVRLARLAGDPRLPGLRLDTVRAILSGGSALPTGPAQTLSTHFGVPVLQGYGLAETSPLTHCDSLDRPKRDSVGYPVIGTECRIVDVERRTVSACGERGEVQVRGPQVMLGYLGQDSPVGEDGWLSTGDVGYLDADNALFLVDRIKDVFKCDNEMVAPTEIERVLLRHRMVADCVVIDYPDALHGAVPHAVVVPTGPDARDTDVAEFVNARVAPFQRVRQVEFTDRIPRSPTGKVERRAVRQQVLARAGHNDDRRNATVIKFVNKLTVTGDQAEFEAVSEELTAYMRRQPGYVRFELLRSMRDDKVYVEIAEWTSAQAHRDAVQSEGFRDRVKPLGALATVDPDVFTVVREGSVAGD